MAMYYNFIYIYNYGNIIRPSRSATVHYWNNFLAMVVRELRQHLASGPRVSKG